MNLEVLRSIGLSEGEIKVYHAILDLGTANIAQINEKVNIHRRNIYDILTRLIEKGLVSYTDENNKRRYSLTNPSKILGYIEEKKKELENSKQTISKEIPEILERFNSKKFEIKTDVYRGIEGVKAVFEDTLNYPETYWIGG